MTVLVECRCCGFELEIDVLEISGQWWRRCPGCIPRVDKQPPSEADGERNASDGGADAASATLEY
jgi:hypothetical protein